MIIITTICEVIYMAPLVITPLLIAISLMDQSSGKYRPGSQI